MHNFRRDSCRIRREQRKICKAETKESERLCNFSEAPTKMLFNYQTEFSRAVLKLRESIFRPQPTSASDVSGDRFSLSACFKYDAISGDRLAAFFAVITPYMMLMFAAEPRVNIPTNDARIPGEIRFHFPGLRTTSPIYVFPPF